MIAASDLMNDVGVAVAPDVYPLNGILSAKAPLRSIIWSLSSTALICAVVELLAPTILSATAQGPAVIRTSRYL